MTNRYNTRLLSAILGTQDERKATGALSEERARQALTVGPPLSPDERRLIWMSPDARDVFLAVRRQVRADAMERVRDAGLGTAERRLAASGGNADEIVGNGFTVTVFRDDIPGAEWSVSLQLAPEYLALIGSSTAIVLRDSGGHVWVSGLPDSQGCVSVVWELSTESPRSRLQRFSLALEP
ncbi:hypothetical protein TSA1_26665 [Bradyrhizobium nitroreducens]|uniref:Uncharacterized protein n=1 Tax=Bradyrhizobium nitroreducens TaxID=709803 RepID=A0A2M6UH85_9BRAD|nr:MULTISPECIES: hypothetical protein [Bradyrhizobium]MBJ7402192.1 hypothetical protein [Bradyrhizobium sp.]MBR0926327.1 hypothetical protein [Bradyrhizobium diazoefficiens]PIT03953.1 hypothetical protein TSA1_26665 [Bradyrhizobium nitroreducens]